MAIQPTNAFDASSNQKDESTDLSPASGVTAAAAVVPEQNLNQQITNMSIMTQTTSNFAEGEVESLAAQHADITVENQRRGDDDVDNLAGSDDDEGTALPIASDDDSSNASTMTVSDDSESTAVHHADTPQDSPSMLASSTDTPDDSFSSSSGDSLGSAGQDVFLLHNGEDAGAGGALGGTEITASTDSTGGADQTWGSAEQAPAGGDAFDTPGGMNFDDASSSLPPIDMGGGGF